jgi:hypothetical protein
LAQKSIVINAGLRLNSRPNYFFTHDNKPLGIILGAGIDYNNRYRTSVGFQYFKTESERTIADYYIFDITVKRYFHLSALPSLCLNLALKAGYYNIAAIGISPPAPKYHRQVVGLSASCGASYSISKHIAIDLSPGLTWFPTKHPNVRIGSFIETGVSVKF